MWTRARSLRRIRTIGVIRTAQVNVIGEPYERYFGGVRDDFGIENTFLFLFIRYRMPCVV
jgi:hypothetical protein